MKKAIGLLLVVLIIGGAALGIGFYRYMTAPVWALREALEDVKAEGLEGLRPHLTDRKAETLDRLLEIKENRFVSYVGGLLQGDHAVLAKLMDGLSEVDWSLGEVKRKGDAATVTVRFAYDAALSGSIDIGMVRTEGDWKIDELSFSGVSWQRSSDNE